MILPSRQLEHLARSVWRLPGERVIYLPNGVDCQRFRPREVAKHDGPLIIGTVATLRAEKNLLRLIRVARGLAATTDLAPFRLVIVGDGPERAKLAAAINAAGAEAFIELAGPTSKPETAHQMFDIFALSSDTEQMPLSILEAMATGLPIASVAVGDVIDMVAAENRRFVTPPDDEPAFAASIETLLRTRICVGPSVRPTQVRRARGSMRRR